MKQSKCNICEKYKPTLNGVCNECKSVKAYEVSGRVLDAVMSTEYHNRDEQVFKSLTKVFFRDMENVCHEENDYEIYLKMTEAEKRKWEFNKICKLNSLSQSLQTQYRPQLMQIFKKYRGFLLDGDVEICTIEEYERTGTGEVCDVVGNFVLRRFVNAREDGLEVKRSALIVDQESLLKFFTGEASLEDLDEEANAEKFASLQDAVARDSKEMGIEVTLEFDEFDDLEDDEDDEDGTIEYSDGRDSIMAAMLDEESDSYYDNVEF